MVPDTAQTNIFKLTFGDNKNLEITENVKIVEAYRHDQRVTLIYVGLGAFTFEYKEASSLSDENDWQATYLAKEFTVGLIFKNGERVNGKGKTKNEEQVEVKITLDRKPENWIGFFTD